MSSLTRRMQRRNDRPARRMRNQMLGSKLGFQNPQEPMPHNVSPVEAKRLKALRNPPKKRASKKAVAA